MLAQYFIRITLSLLFAGLSVLSAEIVIIKQDKKDSSKTIPLDQHEKKNYQDKIFDLITRFQWPTNILYAAEMTPEERDNLFAPGKKNTEADYITKKLKETYTQQSYQAVFIPSSLYQLVVIAYFAEHLTSGDPLAPKLIACAKDCADYLLQFYCLGFNEDEATNNKYFYKIELPSSLEKFYETCKEQTIKKEIKYVSFLISQRVGEWLKEQTINAQNITSENWKTLAVACIKRIIEKKASFDNLDVPSREPLDQENKDEEREYYNSARFHYDILRNELRFPSYDSFRDGSLINTLIDKEIVAHEKNQALLLNASGSFSLPIGVYSAESINSFNTKSAVALPTCSLEFKTFREMHESMVGKQDFVPHATSYGIAAFNGAFYCKYDMPYCYAVAGVDDSDSEESTFGTLFKPSTYFFALTINKNEYVDSRCDNLFIIPPFSPLIQIFGLDSMYHALSTVAYKKLPTGWQGVNGFDLVFDNAKILRVQDDPISHAQRMAAFLAKNTEIIHVPEGKIKRDGQQLLGNFAQAALFFQQLHRVQQAQEKIQNYNKTKSSAKKSPPPSTEDLLCVFHHYLLLITEINNEATKAKSSSQPLQKELQEAVDQLLMIIGLIESNKEIFNQKKEIFESNSYKNLVDKIKITKTLDKNDNKRKQQINDIIALGFTWINEHKKSLIISLDKPTEEKSLIQQNLQKLSQSLAALSNKLSFLKKQLEVLLQKVVTS